MMVGNTGWLSVSEAYVLSIYTSYRPTLYTWDKDVEKQNNDHE